MNSQNLTNPDKEIYQQPTLKVITVRTNRCILDGSNDTYFEPGGDHVQ